jgi:hypothetical protein
MSGMTAEQIRQCFDDQRMGFIRDGMTRLASEDSSAIMSIDHFIENFIAEKQEEGQEDDGLDTSYVGLTDL